MNAKNLIMTLLVYLLLVCSLALLGIKLLNWSEYYHLAQNAVKTVGEVTAKEPHNHNFVRYSFQADHKSYSGFGNAGGENPEFDELKVGDPVNVYYDSQNPDHSFLGNPRKQADSVTTGVLFLTLIGSGFSMFALYRKGWLPISKK